MIKGPLVHLKPSRFPLTRAPQHHPKSCGKEPQQSRQRPAGGLTEYKKTASYDAVFLKFSVRQRLTLGELEAGAGAWLPWLLALFHPWVTGKETFRLDKLAVLWVELGEGAGDRVTDRNSLGMLATTFNDNFHIKLVNHVHDLERGNHRVLEIESREIFLKGESVDGHFTGAFGNPCAGNGGLAATCGALCSDSWHNLIRKRLVS